LLTKMIKTVFRIASLAAVVAGLALVAFFATQYFTGGASENVVRGFDGVAPTPDETLKLTVPRMERIKDVTVPTAVPDQEALRNNVAVRIPGTGLPWQKEANVYIAGHELGYPFTDSFRAFYDLKKLEKGDEIYLTDADGRRYTYEVFDVMIVQPTDLWVLDPVEGKNIVSLQGSETQQQVGDNIPKRVVRAELKDVEG